jgi:DNA repair photolyase
MAVIEIQAKTLLAHIKEPDGIFGMKYNMNLYRGCQHQCIYCDSRSECYGIENFQDIQVKINALDLLQQELPRKRVKGKIGTGSMNDPYMPLEKQLNLTGRALEIIARHGFGVSVITKSSLVLRDSSILAEMGRARASVSFSVSTVDDELGRKVEPGAALVSQRYQALNALAKQGLVVGVCMMPILPFLEDTFENVSAIVEQAVANGASYVIPWFGMSMRDRQREYYYSQLDRLFPGLRAKYEQAFGLHYECPARWAERLSARFYELCERYHLATRVPPFIESTPAEQLALF